MDREALAFLHVQDFMKKLGTPSGAGTGLFAPKPLFWERPSFVIWTAAQPDPEQAEAAFAAADPQFAELKAKYDRSRRTVTRTGMGGAASSVAAV